MSGEDPTDKGNSERNTIGVKRDELGVAQAPCDPAAIAAMENFASWDHQSIKDSVDWMKPPSTSGCIESWNLIAKGLTSTVDEHNTAMLKHIGFGWEGDAAVAAARYITKYSADATSSAKFVAVTATRMEDTLTAMEQVKSSVPSVVPVDSSWFSQVLGRTSRQRREATAAEDEARRAMAAVYAPVYRDTDNGVPTLPMANQLKPSTPILGNVVAARLDREDGLGTGSGGHAPLSPPVPGGGGHPGGSADPASGASASPPGTGNGGEFGPGNGGGAGRDPGATMPTSLLPAEVAPIGLGAPGVAAAALPTAPGAAGWTPPHAGDPFGSVPVGGKPGDLGIGLPPGGLPNGAAPGGLPGSGVVGSPGGLKPGGNVTGSQRPGGLVGGPLAARNAAAAEAEVARSVRPGSAGSGTTALGAAHPPGSSNSDRDRATPGYLVNADNGDELVGKLPLVAPPVIGEWQ